MLITTPASLIRFVNDGTFSLSHARYVTIDEADTMFEKGFGNDVTSLLQQIQASAKSQKAQYQISIVSATIPKQMLELLNKRFPDLLHITTPTLHKAVPNCRQHFVDLKHYQGNRSLALFDALRNFEVRKSATATKKLKDRALIFCNTRKGVMLTYRALKDKGIPALCLYGGVPSPVDPPSDRELVKRFLNPNLAESITISPRSQESNNKSIDESTAVDITEEDSDSQPRILVCTDIASRGLDTTSCNHVILYDFPTSVVDYLHRIGRTARAGKTGTVTCLIGKKDRALAERIRRSVKTNNVLS
ncbi:P-loop containing nucleoside triphosphate hydrolase protein [Conidiobolus coronatus NRRL 28638]|uniref:p-loop containing nucleoside triphosphate hydrolase protein n=1 Tax=Conidiobolus coronatus (strain ATCC 28846 / CBS 209.66 / NRRL 28638) TaxID=796925 RepID=A0A137PAU0_CONC2|nr:P-loop containing nucleoside triphosphate hydrolase protein [Conidiobolus coronatus NRRL 28638]|eukprot:KXN72052.1 P-loop containing nucleoside triphosphate hydrolase protein [Conidiobolus coronatus NRRL 28638]